MKAPLLLALVVSGSFLVACGGDPAGAPEEPAAGDGTSKQAPHAEREDGGAATTDGAPVAGEDAGACAWRDAKGACRTPVPANAGALGDLVVAAPDVVVPKDTTFDTDASCKTGSVLGDCSVAFQADAPAVCVCRARSFDVSRTIVVGPRALALFATEHVIVRELVDVAGVDGWDGPGAQAGASFATGNVEIVPLRGGRPGAAAHATNARGGGGGGAIQITAGVDIVVLPTGTIQAGGGGGRAWAFAGAGGGDGGAILLEAPEIRLEGKLLANGGGGAGGGDGARVGDPGENAWGPAVAKGGDARDGVGCAAYGDTEGGHGGDGATRDAAAKKGGAYDAVSCFNSPVVYAGGDGGGLGRIRLATEGGTRLFISQASYASPAPSTGAMTFAP